MNQYKRNLFLALLLSIGISQVQAQSGTGSKTVENSSVNIAPGTTEMRFSENTYFGPEADWTIDGTLEIWSKNIWIATDAKIKGTGKIVIHNPGTNPFYPDMANGSSAIDGNNSNFINLLVEHHNEKNLVLNDIVDPGYDTYNPPGPDAARVNFGAELNLAKNGANIILNGHDLGFSTSGTITDYSSSRMIVTGNSINGHVIKSYADNSSFTFPIGVEAKDYTPVIITPDAKGEIHLSVQDYIASNTRLEDARQGMDRSWHIYSPQNLKADLILYHNEETNGSNFDAATAEVRQYKEGVSWDQLNTRTLSEGVHQTLFAQIVANQIENGAWFTKYSKGLHNVAALFIPNVFTPNGDGSYDTFNITGIDNFDRVELTVFNRWGNEVYRNGEYKNNWSGQGLNEGTYYYLIKVTKDGKSEEYKGWVLLKR